jgi:hypothetical protein
MALTTSEIQRLKYELGFNVLAVGAEPYIGVAALFEQVIQPYTTAGAATTSSTTVVAASAPALTTLTVASATGINAGDVLVVDVDSLQERATVRSISGTSVSLLLSKAHSGTYPVVVEGGETLIRDCLRKLASLGLGSVGSTTSALDAVRDRAGIKRIDDVEFFDSSSGSPRNEITALREMWRDELASLLGIVRLNGPSSGSSCSVY